MRRILIIILVLLPVIIIGYRSNVIQRFIKIFPYKFSKKINPGITFESKIPTHSAKIVDTGFLDFIFAQLNVFGPQAIIDPEIYVSKSNIESAKRHTISRVNIELVPKLDQYLLAFGGTTDFEARGTYKVYDGTLYIQISLNPEEIPGSDNSELYVLEDVYLTAALQTLVYAVGTPGKALDIKKLDNLRQNYDDYIKSGIFQRPIQINKSGE